MRPQSTSYSEPPPYTPVLNLCDISRHFRVLPDDSVYLFFDRTDAGRFRTPSPAHSEEYLRRVRVAPTAWAVRGPGGFNDFDFLPSTPPRLRAAIVDIGILCFAPGKSITRIFYTLNHVWSILSSGG
ncbi:hypothetical protein NEOLEDRAFT_1142378, partial [Neolentinus lepideus HHB14362 ss-1]